MVNSSQAHWNVIRLPCCSSGATSSSGMAVTPSNFSFPFILTLNIQEDRLHSYKQCTELPLAALFRARISLTLRFSTSWNCLCTIVSSVMSILVANSLLPPTFLLNEWPETQWCHPVVISILTKHDNLFAIFLRQSPFQKFTELPSGLFLPFIKLLWISLELCTSSILLGIGVLGGHRGQ